MVQTDPEWRERERRGREGERETRERERERRGREGERETRERGRERDEGEGKMMIEKLSHRDTDTKFAHKL